MWGGSCLTLRPFILPTPGVTPALPTTKNTHTALLFTLYSLAPQDFFNFMEGPCFLLPLGMGACCSFARNPLHLPPQNASSVLHEARACSQGPPISALTTLHGIFLILVLPTDYKLHKGRDHTLLFTPACLLPGAWHAFDKYHLIEEWLWDSLFHWWPPIKHTSWYSHTHTYPPAPLNWAVPVTCFNQKKAAEVTAC